MPENLPAVLGDQFMTALAQAGVITWDDQITRVVVDAQVGHLVKVYVERIGDERLLAVVPAMTRVEVSQ